MKKNKPGLYNEGDEKFYASALALAVSIASPTFYLMVAYRILISIFAILFIATVGYLAIKRADRDPPTDVAQARLLTPRVAAGQEVFVAFSVVRKKSCQVDISFDTKDGADVVEEGVTRHKDATGPLGSDYVVHSFKVPAKAATGAGRLRVTWSWQCPDNPTQMVDPIVRVFQFDLEIVKPA